MPIPPPDAATGNLPPGVHPSSWVELDATFWRHIWTQANPGGAPLRCRRSHDARRQDDLDRWLLRNSQAASARCRCNLCSARWGRQQYLGTPELHSANGVEALSPSGPLAISITAASVCNHHSGLLCHRPGRCSEGARSAPIRMRNNDPQHKRTQGLNRETQCG